MKSSVRVLVGLVAVIGLAGCSSGSHQPAKPSPTVTPTPASPTSSAGAYQPHIDPANFTDKVSNPYFPLPVGRTLVFDGTKDGAPEHVDVTIVKGTKTIMGVQCSVISDVVTISGSLHEKTTDWYAQDKQGNVWYFGEDSAEYVNGVVSSTQGTWEAGVDGAQPGIIMKAQSAVGQSYRQEYRPGVAEDHAQVLTTNATLKVPAGQYHSLVLTLDRDPLNPDKIEHKWYAAGLGMISAVRLGSAHEEHVSLTKILKN